MEQATRDWAERERGPREAEVRARVSRERREGTAGCCWRSRWPVGEWFTWVKARGGWAAERGLGQVELLGQENEKGRTGLGWWGWAAGPRAGLRTGLPQRDEVGRRPGREERGNWARVGFGLSFQGCLGFGPGCKSLGWAHMFELGLS